MAGPVGSAVGVLSGVAVGGAATVALQPAFEIPRQDAWERNANRILDVTLLARLVAQGGVNLGSAAAEAKREGYGPDKLDALVYLEQTVPGVGEATALWRRGLISDTLFQHALVKAGLDPRYAAAIIRNKTAEPLGLGDIAYAIVRGILPAPSYVPVPVPASGDKVPRYPVVNADPEALAALLGYSPESLEIMVGRSGLSMAPGMAAQALFRGIIGPNDYRIAIGEGDLRTEWADAVRDVSRSIPSPHDYAELQLRGFLTQAERDAGAARHGMSGPDTQRLYDVAGRAPSIKQVYTGLARGAVYDGTPQTIPEPFLSAVQRANIRPEWYSIEYANRYTEPSAFVVRALLRDGAIDATRGQTILENEGWAPDLAALVATHYAAGGATGADAHVTKAENQLWTTAHRSYVAQEIDDPTATAAVEAAGVAAASAPAVLTLWKHERSLIRKQLSPAQIKKAVKGGLMTQAEGVAALLARGYDQADATILLAE